MNVIRPKAKDDFLTVAMFLRILRCTKTLPQNFCTICYITSFQYPKVSGTPVWASAMLLLVVGNYKLGSISSPNSVSPPSFFQKLSTVSKVEEVVQIHMYTHGQHDDLESLIFFFLGKKEGKDQD